MKCFDHFNIFSLNLCDDDHLFMVKYQKSNIALSVL